MRFSLHVLGSVSLEGPSGPLTGPAVQPRQLALLAMLAVAGREGVSRDKILACLWPEATTDSARHSLADAIYLLRKALGQEAIEGRSPRLFLNLSVVSADVVEFEDALRGGDLAAAAELNGGPFLDGLHLRDASEFEHWRDAEARRLDHAMQSALEALADRYEENGEHHAAIGCLRRLLALDPYNSRVVIRLMEVQAAAGDPANAMKLAAEHVAFLAEELAVNPPAELLALAERLRGADHQARTASPVAPPVPVEQPDGGVRDSPSGAFVRREPGLAPLDAVAPLGEAWVPRELTAGPRPRGTGAARSRRNPFRITPAGGLAGVVVAAVAVTAGYLLFRSSLSGLPADRVAVFPFRNRTGDASLEREADFAKFAIENSVGVMDLVRLVPEESVLRHLAADGPPDFVDIARRLGAGTAITADITVFGESLRLGAQIIDVATGDVVYSLNASGPRDDPRVAVQELASRVLGALAVRLGDSRSVVFITSPPSYEAYNAYALAVERFNAVDYAGALEHFREAYRLDTTFVAALKGVSAALFNLDRYSECDSVVAVMEARRSEFSPLDQQGVEFHRALLDGDLERALVAAREALRLDDRGESAIPVIVFTRDTNRPRELLQVWTDYGSGRDSQLWSWWPIWYAVGNAQHVIGRQREVLETVRIGQELLPDQLSLRFVQVRALIGLGRLDEVDSLLNEVGRQEASPGFSWSPGLLFRHAAWELARHGHARESLRTAERAVTWYESREPQPLALSEALLAAGRVAEAVDTLRGAVAAAEAPGDVNRHGLFGVALAHAGDRAGARAEAHWLESLTRPYLFGRHTYWRAAIAANLGEKESAVRLLRTSVRQGQSSGFLHYDAHFAPLWGYEPFEDLIRPNG